MSRVAGTVGSLLVLCGGLGMAVAGARAQSRRGVRRLHAVLDDPAAKPGSDASALAALWTQLARTADHAGRGSSLFASLGQQLDRAGWLLRPAELVVVALAAAVVGVLAGALVADTLGAVAGGLAGLGAPVLALRRTAGRLTRRVEAQLPDVLAQLAASMRAGLSLTQSLDAVADEGSEPMSTQLGRVLAETRVGVPLEEALAHMADRVGSVDLRWAVRAMAIQAHTGGRLSDILEVLAEFMRDREEVRREVRALTAEGRISALVLLALPFFVAGGILATRPGYLLPLFSDPLGIAMVGVSAVLMTVATFWIRRIVRIEV